MNGKYKTRIGMALAYMGGSPIFLIISENLPHHGPWRTSIKSPWTKIIIRMRRKEYHEEHDRTH